MPELAERRSKGPVPWALAAAALSLSRDVLAADATPAGGSAEQLPTLTTKTDAFRYIGSHNSFVRGRCNYLSQLCTFEVLVIDSLAGHKRGQPIAVRREIVRSLCHDTRRQSRHPGLSGVVGSPTSHHRRIDNHPNHLRHAPRGITTASSLFAASTTRRQPHPPLNAASALGLHDLSATMSLLSAHLDQIAYSCEGIDALPIFTNALLSNHDITSLIRDTEPHERALFSVPPPPPPPTASRGEADAQAQPGAAPARRQTIFNVASGEVTTGPPTRGSTHPRRHTAVAAVLGGEMHEQLRRGTAASGDVVDVEVLLRGADKLCGVYELPGARERIADLRAKHRNGKNTAAYYEAKVAAQAEQLAGMNKGWMDDGDDDADDQEDEDADESEMWTEEDLRREEEEARQMEVKKRELQARLRAMEKDLGGLMNIASDADAATADSPTLASSLAATSCSSMADTSPAPSTSCLPLIMNLGTPLTPMRAASSTSASTSSPPRPSSSHRSASARLATPALSAAVARSAQLQMSPPCSKNMRITSRITRSAPSGPCRRAPSCTTRCESRVGPMRPAKVKSKPSAVPSCAMRACLAASRSAPKRAAATSRTGTDGPVASPSRYACHRIVKVVDGREPPGTVLRYRAMARSRRALPR
ncbi:DASH complex subunit Spc34 [Purpureocillium lavendulum]|uniref:DASH complex subunit SPC34 n=1 Tax=Purpureocillium lavendulum TaxID=1247861 RepID=A0AB34FRG3_9HYPO|nr:DASH complex subunit Spc34 [Purpureocillium lavendulum]